MAQLLKAIIDTGGAYAPLAKRLAKLKLDVPVSQLSNARETLGKYSYEVGNPASRRIEIAPTQQDLARVILHETAHAGIDHVLETDAGFRATVERMIKQVESNLDEAQKEQFQYYLGSAKEFVAGVHSDLDFQAALRSMRDPTPRTLFHSLWGRLVDGFRKALGLAPQDNALYREILQTTGRRMLREKDVASAMEKEWAEHGGVEHLNMSSELLGVARGMVAGLGGVMTNFKVDGLGSLGAAMREKMRKMGLFAGSLQQIEFVQGHLFEDPTTKRRLLRDYKGLMGEKQALIQEWQREGEDRIRRWEDLGRKDRKTADQFNWIAHNARMFQFDPRRSVADNEQRLGHRINRKAHAQLADAFNKLPQAWKDMFAEVQQSYARKYREMLSLFLQRQAEAYEIAQGTKMPAGFSAANMLQSQIDTYFPKLDSDVRRQMKSYIKARDEIGDVPYFPFYRRGEHVLSGTKTKSRHFADRAALEDHLNNNIETRVDKETVNANGSIDADLKSEWVSFHDNSFLAKQERAQLIKAGKFTEQELPASRLREKFSYASNAAPQKLISKLDAAFKSNAPMHRMLMQELMAHLPETSLKRHLQPAELVAGASMDMLQADAVYSHTFSNWYPQVFYGKKLAEALQGLTEFNDKTPHGLDRDARQEVINTLHAHDQLDQRSFIPGKVAALLNNASALWCLAGPSFAITNLTQVPAVGAPYLAAHVGPRSWPKTLKVLAEGYASIGPYFLKQYVKAGAGMRGLLALEMNRMPRDWYDPVTDMFNLLMKGNFFKSQKQKDQFQLIFNEMNNEGRFNYNFGHDLRTMRERGAYSDNPLGRAWSVFSEFTRYVPTLSEGMNKMIMAATAYRLAAEHDPHMSSSDIKYAITSAVDDTQIDANRMNESLLFKNIRKIPVLGPDMLMFKSYCAGHDVPVGADGVSGHR